MPVVLTSTYPADGDVGLPIGLGIVLEFDQGIDIKTLTDSVIVYGPDFDTIAGPYTAQWVGQGDEKRPYFLKSPGFKGIFPIKLTEVIYFDKNTNDLFPNLDVVNKQQEIDDNLGVRVIFKPDPAYNAVFAKDTEYCVHVVGDPDELNQVGVSSRTVFSPVEIANTGDGAIHVRGPYTGATQDTLHIKITKAGSVQEAKFKYWYDSAGEPSAVLGKLTSGRFRHLVDGIELRFSGDDFEVGDEWSIAVEPILRMEDNIKFKFCTGDGSYIAAPESPSTPAPAVMPASVFPGLGNNLLVSEMLPKHTSYNNNIDKRIITIWFSEDLDATTITNDTVKLIKYPVNGSYQYSPDSEELQKTLEVDGNMLIIKY